jgi:PhzF family phenazine biosynthesis protein
MTSETQLPFYQVDAFTDRPFAGNPAGVCLLDSPLPPHLMQAIAAEMNLSETAFVQPPDAQGLRVLRWFTPTVEVPLCGHATLAAAHVLLREAGVEPPLRFSTLSGTLEVGAQEGGWLRMDFPTDPPTPATAPVGLLDALECPYTAPTLVAAKGWVVRLASEADVRRVRPDYARLGEVDLGPTALGVIVTAPGAGDADFVSRFFGPWVGVDEDPVTGMAHTILGPYWARETVTPELRARQVSARGGTLLVRMMGDRVHISGQAVTVVRGGLSLPAV